MENDSSQKSGFNELLRDIILPKVERIGIVILAIGLTFKILNFPGFPAMLGISLTTLAVASFLIGFLTVSPTPIATVFTKVGFISSAIILVGIQFTLLHLPGGYDMLKIGVTSGGISAIGLAYIAFLQGFTELKKTVYRIALIFSAGLMVFLDLI